MNGCGGLFSFKTFLIKSLDSSHIPDTIKNYTIPVLKKGLGQRRRKNYTKYRKKKKQEYIRKMFHILVRLRLKEKEVFYMGNHQSKNNQEAISMEEYLEKRQRLKRTKGAGKRAWYIGQPERDAAMAMAELYV